MKNNYTPIKSATHYWSQWMKGHVKFPRRILQFHHDEGGSYFTYRHVKIVNKESEKPVVLRIDCVLPKKMNFRYNRYISHWLVPYFCGLPGFREMYLCVDISRNGYMGLFEFEDSELAEAFVASYVYSFLKDRSLEETIEYRIMDQPLEEYIERWNHKVA